jgi:branched-chain amino acid transport system permease protein
LLGRDFPTYRVFLIVFSSFLIVLLWFGVERTRWGAMVRAAVDNRAMAQSIGINTKVLFMATFALGSGLAGLGGALAIEIVGLDHSFALAYLVYVLIVVSVGGLGSIGGSFAAAALLGISDMFGKYYFPELGAFLIYLVMIAILVWRPHGLFGRR